MHAALHGGHLTQLKKLPDHVSFQRTALQILMYKFSQFIVLSANLSLTVSVNSLRYVVVCHRLFSSVRCFEYILGLGILENAPFFESVKILTSEEN
jgi:hypothetical protein